MNELTLPPSPNWYLSSILACANDGTIAWGSRSTIVIAKAKETSKDLDFSIIDRAHSERVSCITFSPNPNEIGFYRLASGGEDNTLKIWDLQDLKMETKNSTLNSGQKVIGIDWSKHNTNLICFVSDDGILVTWNVNYDTSQTITLGKKLSATCLSCCPHDSNVVAIGFKNGLVYLIDIRGSGSITYKLSSHDSEIVSLSWCPVPINVFETKETKEFLLASGAKDRDIYLWKAGTDGRYETKLTFPVAPIDTSAHKGTHKSSPSTANFTAVCWLEPTTLLTSSPWGELLMWDLNGTPKKKFTPKLIHAKHGRGLFAIAGLANESITLSEDNSEDKSENWRSRTNIKAIWTLAQDRQVVGCSLVDSETSIEYTIPTQGGFVYCMSACPVDTSQIAFGVGDAMIRLWNLSEPNVTIIEMQMLWEKIKGKVRAISWHPEKENLLAFATNEGRVGTFDTNFKKPPILYRQYHRHIIYSIGWGPAPNIKEYALYTCGDGELVYYNPEKPDDYPVPVIKAKECTEFSWKPDYSLLAIGFGDGSISFLNHDLKVYGNTINLLHKAIQCLTWHPESTSSDLNISPMQNYLAVAINGSAINVFDISTCNPEENKLDQSCFYRRVATLNGHSEKVVCLSWSPHISGYLVSGSYDNTAQVWKIETQEVIATYASHIGPIQCCMWSPFSQDFIITGSADFTLRIWSISKQTVLISSSAVKSTKGKRIRKKKSTKKEENLLTNNDDENEVNGKTAITAEDKKENTNQESNYDEIENVKNVHKSIKRKKLKKMTYFPGYAEVVHDNKLWCQSVRKLKDSLEYNSLDNESGVFGCNGSEHSLNNDHKITNINDSKIPVLLGSRKNLEEILNREKKILESNGQSAAVTEINLWSGTLKETLEEALKNKSLSEYLLSLVLIEDSISTELRDKAVAGYINQLISEDNPNKAVSYLLCIKKIHEALDVFMSFKMYKEAYSLATLKLKANDPVIKNILREWANNAVKDGNFQSATECYLMLGEYSKAAKTLERRKDIDSLILAIEVAEIVNDVDLITSVADKALLETLFVSEFDIAKSIVEKHPQIQFREIEVEVFRMISKILETNNDEIIVTWLKNSSSINLLETLNTRFAKCPEKYSLLLQKDVYPLADLQNENMVKINVSHQIALYVLSDNRIQQIQHIVKACDIISQYEKINLEPNKLLLLKYLCTLDNKNLADASSIFNACENGVSQSLRAYLCHAVITWFHENQLEKERISECIDFIIPIIEKYVEDLLNNESVNYWTSTNEINKLESQLSSLSGQISNDTKHDSTDITTLMEKLDKLKMKKKEFLDKRISVPNPLFSYGAIMEFISKVLDEQKSQKLTELVMATWKKAIS